jgi:hypothetical protein
MKRLKLIGDVAQYGPKPPAKGAHITLRTSRLMKEMLMRKAQVMGYGGNLSYYIRKLVMDDITKEESNAAI